MTNILWKVHFAVYETKVNILNLRKIICHFSVPMWLSGCQWHA